LIAAKDSHYVVIMTGWRPGRRASGGKHGPFKTERESGNYEEADFDPIHKDDEPIT
jgi:hypothetical protein